MGKGWLVWEDKLLSDAGSYVERACVQDAVNGAFGLPTATYNIEGLETAGGEGVSPPDRDGAERMCRQSQYMVIAVRGVDKGRGVGQKG